ncbi:MAG: hypothetical protein HOV78_20315 [Hamadaea sp.]|nr:hypothetical protein [Hamadaea sp.]NUO90626.1 hypothetical protein [Dermatophilaceae bacterium]
MTAAVNYRPQLARDADRALLVIALGIAGCALLGAGLAAAAVAHLTTPPKESS